MSPETPHPDCSPSELITDLFYPSESDEPLEYVEWNLSLSNPVTVSGLKETLQLSPEVVVSEIPEEQFWEPVVREEDWYGDEEKARTERFRKLRDCLGQWVENRQVFRVGETEVTLYLIGRKADHCWAGLKTLLVET